MKKLLLLVLPAAMFLSCSDNKSATETSTGDSVITSRMDDDDDDVVMPYTVAKTPDWERGKNSNVALAMNTLRAFETNDMVGMQQYLADSVEFYIDNMSFKGSRDSLIKVLTRFRGGIDTMWIGMHDYESVKSKNRGEEWVGLWYTEVVKPRGGKMDSTMVMDDIKIVQGKVAVIDSKMRRLVAK